MEWLTNSRSDIVIGWVECIMDYWYAWQGYAHWEWYHGNIIDDNIWRQ